MTVSRDDEKGKELIAAPSNEGKRIDSYVAAEMPDHVSRSRIKDIIKSGGLRLNGNRCDSPNYRIKPGDQISLEIPPPVDAIPQPWEMPLNIVFEDNDLIVIDKPAGIVVHPAAGNWNKTLVNALLHHCGESLAGIGGVKRPGIVHRLDKNTSGLMVVAKTELAHADLSAQFADHGKTRQLERRYKALVWGEITKKNGTITTFLGRSPRARTKRAVVPESAPDARLAVTHYRVFAGYSAEKDGEILLSLVECHLETGRTHQIRVHMAHIGHPVVGDPEYGQHFQTKTGKLSNEALRQAKKLKRQALHSATLRFEHPATGKVHQYSSELPDDMQNLIKSMF